jgi:hypothetical protein
MCSQEYIDLTELDVRLTEMMKAGTEEELKFLLCDLPPLPAELAPLPVKKECRKECHLGASVAYVSSAVAMVIIGIVSSFSLSSGEGLGVNVLSVVFAMTFGMLFLVTRKS